MVSPLRDPLSGLLNNSYFEVTVPERVAVARRTLRPLSLVLVLARSGLTPRERAAVILDCLRGSDTACQLDHEIVGLILEETGEDGAVWTAERLRQGLEAAAGEVAGDDAEVQAGVATYPAHTLNGVELMFAARQALVRATTLPGSRIEIAQLH